MKAGRKTASHVGSRLETTPPPSPSEPESMSSIVEGLTAWTKQISSYQAAWQEEWWGFVGSRLSKDAALWQQLSSCTEPSDVAHTYAEFFKQAIDDYQKEFGTLAQLSSEITIASVPVAPNGHDVLDGSALTMLGKLNA